MDYLHDYLRAIPKADADAIRKALKDNELHFGLEEVSEPEFERLIKQIAETNVALTQLPELGERLEAAPLNEFYTNLSVDLNRLFAEQAAIETAAANYDHITQANLEELRRAVESLQESVQRLEKQARGERGLVLRSYRFQPERAKEMNEEYREETRYLFVDRDGTSLQPAEVNRLYHTYYLSLKKEDETDALRDANGHTTARLDVLYETPGTLSNTNPAYAPEKAIDGTTETFWFNVCLKANNGLDRVSIAPEGRV